MKRVLLTGVGGFVGHHVLEYLLLHTDWQILCLDSFRHKGTISRVDEVLKYVRWESPATPKTKEELLAFNDRVRHFVHDLRVPIDIPLMNKMMNFRVGENFEIHHDEIDYIINIASESAVERSTTDPVSCLRNNYDLMINMLEFARNVDCKKFIHISTDEVYGEAGPVGAHKEWDAIVPSNPYAASKAAQEALLIAYWRTYNMPLVLVNIMNMIGERQDPEKFLPKIIQKIALGEEMPIYSDKGVSGSRVYLHAQNMADALIFLLDREPVRYKDFEKSYEARPDRYNVCGDTEINNLDFAQLVAKIMGKELKYKLVESDSARPGYDRRYALDGSKLADLGWTQPMSFEDSIKRIVEWTLDNPHWIA